MSHILCITSGLTGILNASFELSNRLINAGHSCTLASPLDVASKVKLQGFNYLQLNPVNYDPAPEIKLQNSRRALLKIKRWLYKLSHSKSRREEALKALGMNDFMSKVEGENPELIIIDIELHEHIMTLVTSNYKVILLSQWFSLWNRKGLPSLTDSTIPGNGIKGSAVGLSVRWMQIVIYRWLIFMKKKILTVGTDRRSILHLYARRINFPLRYIRQNFWPGPFSYDVLPVISMTSKEMDFPHVERKNHTYVGPMVYEQRKNDGIRESDILKIVELLAEKKKNNKKLIYCSVSTFLPGDISFLKKVIKAFESREEWMLIIGLGGLLGSDLFSNLPANVHPFRQVPQLQVLAEADLSINHGGIHTINECVHFEVPMLIYSGKKSDQNGCAARMHYHGLGMMADKDVDSVEEIERKIEKVLSSKNIMFNLVNINICNGLYKKKNVILNLADSFLTKSI